MKRQNDLPKKVTNPFGMSNQQVTDQQTKNNIQHEPFSSNNLTKIPQTEKGQVTQNSLQNTNKQTFNNTFGQTDQSSNKVIDNSFQKLNSSKNFIRPTLERYIF